MRLFRPPHKPLVQKPRRLPDSNPDPLINAVLCIGADVTGSLAHGLDRALAGHSGDLPVAGFVSHRFVLLHRLLLKLFHGFGPEFEAFALPEPDFVLFGLCLDGAIVARLAADLPDRLRRSLDGGDPRQLVLRAALRCVDVIAGCPFDLIPSELRRGSGLLHAVRPQ